jgi:hypothetical protein
MKTLGGVISHGPSVVAIGYTVFWLLRARGLFSGGAASGLSVPKGDWCGLQHHCLFDCLAWHVKTVFRRVSPTGFRLTVVGRLPFGRFPFS